MSTNEFKYKIYSEMGWYICKHYFFPVIWFLVRGKEGWDSTSLFRRLCHKHICITNHNANHFKCWSCPICPTLSVHTQFPFSIQSPDTSSFPNKEIYTHLDGLFSILMNRLLMINSSICLGRKKKIFRPLKDSCPQWHNSSSTVNMAKICKIIMCFWVPWYFVTIMYPIFHPAWLTFSVVFRIRSTV